MIILSNEFFVTVALAVLIINMAGIPLLAMKSTYEQEGTPCIEYDQLENTIIISCDATFSDVDDTIKDRAIIEYLGHGEFLMNASLRVNNGVTFVLNSDHDTPDDDLRYLKITGGNGIIVNGKIQIDEIKITSWDPSTNDVIDQNMYGNITRAYIQFAASEGAEIKNSEFAYLGYSQLGKRGFDLFGDGEPSHDIDIKGNTFHHMWRGYYSKGAYNVTIDGNEFHHNINYGVDPHSGTHDIRITNNWIHDDPIGVICSLDCYHIVIEGNKIYNNTKAGIFFSRGMQDSIARNNDIYNSTSGIILSESANNQIYDNTVEAARSEGVLLFNPAEPDEGLTENNLVYNNTISDTPVGVNATSSHSNILGSNVFSNITSSQYHLTRNSNFRIVEQDFDNTLITPGSNSGTSNTVEIAYSGIIEVTEINDSKENDTNSVNKDIDESTQYYNTENGPYRKVMNDDDTIKVNS